MREAKGHCCIAAKQMKERQEEADSRRTLHKRIWEKEEYHLLDTLITSYGQSEEHPLLLSDSDTEIAVIKDTVEDYDVCKEGVETRLIKGECHHCGCNRLRHSRHEPTGDVWVTCVACNMNNHDHDEDKLSW
jgi:hypothetical protein